MNSVNASFYREMKVRLSSPRVLVENILNPIFTLFIFGLAMSSTIELKGVDSNISYLDYFVIGAINISLISSALVAATKIFLDKYLGLYEEMLSYPVSRMSILLGKLLFHLALTTLQILVMLVFVLVISKNPNLNFISLTKLMGIFILGSATWFFVTIIMAMLVDTQDMFNTIYYLILTPIIYTSSIYYPVDKLPGILKYLGYINPLTWLTDLGRYIYLGTQSANLGLEFLALVTLFIISATISFILFNKGIE